MIVKHSIWWQIMEAPLLTRRLLIINESDVFSPSVLSIVNHYVDQPSAHMINR